MNFAFIESNLGIRENVIYNSQFTLKFSTSGRVYLALNLTKVK